MKFLCVDCDESMALTRALGPDDGSMTVVFECSSCGRQTAMLTNSMETQVVRSMGVKIGGSSARKPMETIRDGLNDRMPEGEEAENGSSPSDASETDESSSGCPFTGMVEDAFEAQDEGLTWTPAAKDRLDRIPSMARPMARRGIEDYARENGLSTIDETVMDQIKGRFTM